MMLRGPNSEMARKRGRERNSSPVGPRPPARDVGRQRQPREVVARQKALAGEVAVAVEIRLVEAGLVLAGQQLQLRLGLRAQALGGLFVLGAARGVLDDLGAASHAGLRPPGTGCASGRRPGRSARRPCARTSVEPVGVVPVRGRQLVGQRLRMRPMRCAARACACLRADLCGHRRLQLERRLAARQAQVQHVLEGVPQR